MFLRKRGLCRSWRRAMAKIY